MFKIVGTLVLLGMFTSLQFSFADEWVVKFKIADMDTAAAIKKVGDFTRNLYGVDDVEVHPPDESIIVTFESSDIDLDTLQENIVSADFSITKTIPLKEG